WIGSTGSRGSRAQGPSSQDSRQMVEAQPGRQRAGTAGFEEADCAPRSESSDCAGRRKAREQTISPFAGNGEEERIVLAACERVRERRRWRDREQLYLDLRPAPAR